MSGWSLGNWLWFAVLLVPVLRWLGPVWRWGRTDEDLTYEPPPDAG